MIRRSMGGFLKVVLLITLFFPSFAYALSCGDPTSVIVGDCEEAECTEGFKVTIDFRTYEGCIPHYTIGDATKLDLKTLRLSILWSNREDDQGTIYQLRDDDWSTSSEVELMSERSLDAALRSWKYKILFEKLYLVAWRVLDIFIVLFCSTVLIISIVNFEKRYIRKDRDIRSPFIPQLYIFLFSLIPASYAISFYIIYYTSIFLIVVPLIWAFELIIFILYELVRVLKKGSGNS